MYGKTPKMPAAKKTKKAMPAALLIAFKAKSSPMKSMAKKPGKMK